MKTKPKTITAFDLSSRKIIDVLDTAESDVVTNSDLYQYFNDQLQWSRNRVDRLKALVRYKNVKVKNHP